MKHGIYIFISLSALAHVATIGIATDNYKLPETSEQGRSSIEVSISKYQATPVEQTETKKISSVAQKKTSDSSTGKNNQENTQNIATDDRLKTDNPENAETIIKVTDNNEKIISVLHNEFNKHFYYPRSAQRKNWQGQVLLGFSITPAGQINNIQINKSSGYDILDNAAIDSLSRVSPNEQLVIALNGQTSQHTLPVHYTIRH
ncbi:MAG: TonB family protein [Gammaproteobacteria bacterium]|nr:TonB family protein [Gammaproteobacteria bacterium]